MCIAVGLSVAAGGCVVDGLIEGDDNSQDTPSTSDATDEARSTEPTSVSGSTTTTLSPAPSAQSSDGPDLTSPIEVCEALPGLPYQCAKVLVDGLGARVAEGIAGLLLQSWLLFAGLEQMHITWVATVSAIWVTMLLIATALVWLALSMLLARRLRAEPRDAASSDEGLVVRAPLPDS